MSDETFIASNGRTVVEELRCLKITHPNHYPHFIDLDITAALREYFQHKRDQELGRWRDPENPDVFVYPDPVWDDMNGRCVKVWDERTRENRFEWEKTTEYNTTARRYFEAHPEPKPWQNAEPGEVWVLEFTETPRYTSGEAWVADDEEFWQGAIYVRKCDPEIVAGRRVWPEGETK